MVIVWQVSMHLEVTRCVGQVGGARLMLDHILLSVNSVTQVLISTVKWLIFVSVSEWCSYSLIRFKVGSLENTFYFFCTVIFQKKLCQMHWIIYCTKCTQHTLHIVLNLVITDFIFSLWLISAILYVLCWKLVVWVWWSRSFVTWFSLQKDTFVHLDLVIYNMLTYCYSC
jgi:hypothetical protein